eukprot:3060000-Rhodomonas_salina.4
MPPDSRRRCSGRVELGGARMPGTCSNSDSQGPRPVLLRVLRCRIVLLVCGRRRFRFAKPSAVDSSRTCREPGSGEDKEPPWNP